MIIKWRLRATWFSDVLKFEQIYPSIIIWQLRKEKKNSSVAENNTNEADYFFF